MCCGFIVSGNIAIEILRLFAMLWNRTNVLLLKAFHCRGKEIQNKKIREILSNVKFELAVSVCPYLNF